MFLFKFAWKFVAFLLLVALVIPSWALAKTWYTANNETVRKADAIIVMGAAQLDGKSGGRHEEPAHPGIVQGTAMGPDGRRTWIPGSSHDG